VKVSGVARALTEVGDDDVVGLLHLEGERQSGGHRQVAAEHARVAEDPELVDAAVQCGVAPFDRPVDFANICDIITRGSTPFIRNDPRSRCSGQMKSSLRSPKQVPTMIASWPMPV
jgi:hypothetical protein